MISDDNAIRENIQYSPFTKRVKQQLRKRDSLNVPRGSLLFDPGGVFQKRGGYIWGRGQSPRVGSQRR